MKVLPPREERVSKFGFLLFVALAAVAMGITLLATLLPSAEAARLRPMDIIRYT